MKRFLWLVSLVMAAHLAAAEEMETFTARGHPRASGLDFAISFPKQWNGRRPMGGSTVAAFWTTRQGPGDSMSLIVPSGQNVSKRDVTKDEFRGVFESPALEKGVIGMLPNATFGRKELLPDYKYPAGFLDYSFKVKTPTGELTVQCRNHLVYLGKLMLQVQFYFVQDGDVDRREEYASLMNDVLESLVYPLPPE